MEIGFNNDVIYRGTTFHIQTEDHGEGDPRVSTQLFLSGAIFDSKTVNYGHLIEGIADEEARKAKVRKVMVGAHRALYKKLFKGDYDAALGGKIDTSEVIEEIPDPEKFQPAQERVPEVAQVLEEDGKVTFTFDSGEMIDLASLSQQLSELDVFPPNSGGGFDLFGADSQKVDAVPPPVPDAAPQIVQLVPEKVTYRPTGRLAFQGLIEPEPDTTILRMVTDFLRTIR